MSEFESPERIRREPTVEDVRQLMGASAPHFALHLRNRIHHLVAALPPDHPARVEGEREMRRLEQIAFTGERRGGGDGDLRDMPAIAPRARDAGPTGGSARG